MFFELFGAVEVFGEFVANKGLELVVLLVCQRDEVGSDRGIEAKLSENGGGEVE